MLSVQKYIDVILPLPLKGTFIYSTEEVNLSIGQRVVVQFGVRKLYTAIVKRIHDVKPVAYDVKPLLAILDEVPIVNIIQLKFWDWIADYYMCNLGDVMNAAIPTSFKLASESLVVIHTDFDGDVDHLSADEIRLLNILSHRQELSINGIEKILNIKSIFSFINELIRREIIQIKEDLNDKYKHKEIRIVSFIASDRKLINTTLTPKQNAFIFAYLQLESKYKNKKWVVADLLKEIGFSRAIFNALVSKKIFSINKEFISRLLKSSENLIDKK